MKILFDATELSYLYENSGHKAGVYDVALNLLREFEKLNIDITFTCDYKRYYFLKEIKEFQKYSILEECSFTNKFIGKILFLTKKMPLRFKYFLLILARFYDAYFYKINDKNANKLRNFDAYFSPFTPPNKEIQNSNIKKYRIIHDVIPIIENGYPKSPKDWYYKIYTTINPKDYYFTNSKYTKSDLLKYFPNLDKNHVKTTLLGANKNFVPEHKYSPINSKYVFSLCTLGKRKNLIFAIKNFYKFIEKNNITDLKLILAGGIWEKYKNELYSILSQYDSTKVILTGYIEENELKNYYSNALFFIYPSLYEGFGLPVLEAMQCGCPVITSNVSSLPEVIGNCGITVNPKDDNEMVFAYEKMYFDNTFRKNCSANGLERAKKFSWEMCAKEILDFIKSTL